jgi:hypothetical protein
MDGKLQEMHMKNFRSKSAQIVALKREVPV